MKKSLLLAALAFAGLANAQTNIPAVDTDNLIVPIQDDANKPSSARYQSEMLLWYGAAEDNLYGNDGNYTEFIWDFNMNHPDDSTERRDFIVGFPTIVDVDDPGVEYMWSDVVNVTIDTVFVQIGHENNSGTMDTLVVNIVSTTANGYPQPNNIVWSDTIFTDTSFTGGADWLNSVFLEFPTGGVTVTKDFAVNVRYMGDLTDTAGFIAGFYSDQICTGTTPKAAPAAYGTNTYVWDTRFSAQYGYLPTASGASLYFDCNGNGQSDGYPTDGESFFQNANVACAVTVEDGLSVEEFDFASASIGNLYPNPSTGISFIPVESSEETQAQIQVVDALGRVVLNNQVQITKGSQRLELNASDLASGTYFYTVSINGESATRMMIVK